MSKSLVDKVLNYGLVLSTCVALSFGYCVYDALQTVEKGKKSVKCSTSDSWKKYELKEYPKYNALLPIMAKESKRTGVPLEYLAVICLTESRGEGGQRYEPDFQKKYIEPNYENASEKLKRELASSTGPMQIMYATAVDNGFTGTFEELSIPEKNIECSADYISNKIKRFKLKNPSLETVLRIYNTGTPKGTPHKDYLKRAKDYCDKLNISYEGKK